MKNNSRLEKYNADKRARGNQPEGDQWFRTDDQVDRDFEEYMKANGGNDPFLEQLLVEEEKAWQPGRVAKEYLYMFTPLSNVPFKAKPVVADAVRNSWNIEQRCRLDFHEGNIEPDFTYAPPAKENLQEDWYHAGPYAAEERYNATRIQVKSGFAKAKADMNVKVIPPERRIGNTSDIWILQQINAEEMVETIDAGGQTCFVAVSDLPLKLDQ